MIAKISIQKITDICCISLMVLVFISKISFKSLSFIPYSVPPFIFQYGLHPYINFGMQLVISLILFFIWMKKYKIKTLSLIYKTYIYSLIAILTVQTLLQITLVNIGSSAVVQLAGLGMAVILILTYGVIIPSLFDLKKFVSIILKLTVSAVLISLVGLPLFYGEMFRGGRFVGFFKHIPHMVTTATTGFIFFFPSLFNNQKWTLKNNIFLKILILTFLALAVLLTSTKAAFGTIAITTLIGPFLFGSKKKSIQLFKFSFLACFIITILLVGIPTSQFVYDVSTGKISFGLRKAQDGVQTRMEEVTRGWSMFEKNPYLGSGLLYKFLNNTKEGIEVESYNSFKDPHNLFVSAGVIGGYPLILFAILG